jgi:hypothetical protein
MRNRKAIEDVLTQFSNKEISEAKARVFLSGIGMSEKNIQLLIDDALDGSVDTLPAESEIAGAE